MCRFKIYHKKSSKYTYQFPGLSIMLLKIISFRQNVGQPWLKIKVFRSSDAYIFSSEILCKKITKICKHRFT